MRVYLAGPMTSSGEPGPNLHRAAKAATALVRRGHAVYVPHATWLLDAINPTRAEHWLANDRAWVAAADVVLRLPGASPKAGTADAAGRTVSRIEAENRRERR